MEDGSLILLSGALLALGIAATLVAGRLRVPGLVLFLLLGMAIGSDGLALIDFGASNDDYELARTIGIVALGLILFEGGLSAGWGEIRPVFWPAISLATLGTVLTALICGLTAHWLLDLTVLQGMLLGAVIASTDGAAIFSVLRGSSIKRRLARTLEGESGLNDPIGVLLVLGFIDWIDNPGYGIGDLLLAMVQELSIGAGTGLAIGGVAVAAFRRATFSTSGLYPVASIATAAIAFGAADQLHGSGFLAVYLAGLMLGSATIPARRTIDDFHSGLAWVGQIGMFFTLGLLVFPSQIDEVALDGLLLTAVLIFVARPLATLVSTALGGYSLREQALLGWAGLRGALPVVFATFVVLDLDNTDLGVRFFNIVFFVVLISTLVQGASFEPIARALGLTTSQPALERPLMEVGTVRKLGAEVLEFPVRATDEIVGRLVNELGLPRDALVNVIVRADEALLPRGSTEIHADDRLHILVREPARKDVEAMYERWRDGPLRADAEPPAATPLRGSAPIFSVKPWRDEWGDPAAPDRIDGLGVVRILRTRRDDRGALLVLADGRLAVTGEGLLATGGGRQLSRWCRERIHRARTEQARAWWQEVLGAMSQSGVR